MAAVGHRTGTTRNRQVFGGLHIVIAPLAAVSDTNTYNTGLRKIIDGGAFVSFQDDAAVAADSIAIASISGGTVTFQVAGTARAANLVCYGYM